MMDAMVAVVALSFLGAEDVLTEEVRTEHFSIRFRAGSRAEAFVDRVAVKAEEDRQRILRRLEYPEFIEPITLYLYDDSAELQAITGVEAGAFSTTRTSHLPCDDDQTRLHELVHVVAEFLPEPEGEPRSLFFAEGLANAVLEFVHGVHVHAAAAYEVRRGRVPPLQDLLKEEDFYGWLRKNPGVNGYDVAGSYLLHLIETYGMKKVRRYYRGASAERAFGKGLSELDREWRERLEGVTLRPGLLSLLRQRGGESSSFTKYQPPVRRLSPEELGGAELWQPLDEGGLGNGVGRFEREEDRLRGEAPLENGDWAQWRLFDEELGDAWARCRVAPGPGGCFGVKLALGQDCEAILLKNGVFVYTPEGGVAHDPAIVWRDEPVEIVLRREAGVATIWIDGVQVLVGEVRAKSRGLDVGVVQGKASFERVALRR